MSHAAVWHPATRILSLYCPHCPHVESATLPSVWSIEGDALVLTLAAHVLTAHPQETP